MASASSKRAAAKAKGGTSLTPSLMNSQTVLQMTQTRTQASSVTDGSAASPTLASDHRLVRRGHASLANRPRIPQQAIAFGDRQPGERLEKLCDSLTLALFQQAVHRPVPRERGRILD